MSTFTPEQKLALVKHLAAGKPADVVATIMHTTREAVIDLARNHGYPDTEKLAWAADIMAKNIEEGTALPERPLAEGARLSDRPTPPRPGDTVVPIAAAKPDDVMAMLNGAKSHTSKRIQAAADKALDAIGRVRQLVVEDEKKNHEKRKAERERAAARAEVEKLEQALAEAKAKLRGKPSATTKPAATKSARTTAPRGEYPCRNEGCDRVLDTPQGRSLHERLRCEHREDVAS